MLLEFNTILGKSYALKEVKQDREGAVSLLREALVDSPDMREVAESELARMKAFIKARTAKGCHVTKISHDLVAAALEGI